MNVEAHTRNYGMKRLTCKGHVRVTASVAEDAYWGLETPFLWHPVQYNYLYSFSRKSAADLVLLVQQLCHELQAQLEM